MANRWRFECLNHFFDEVLTPAEHSRFFGETLPGMVRLALRLPEVCPAPIPLLRQGQPAAVTLSQLQIACLLCHSFLCTFPARGSTRARKTLPRVSFEGLYNVWDDRVDQKLQKLRCFVAYFEAIVRTPPSGSVTVVRHYLPDGPAWGTETAHFGDLSVSVDAKIEDLEQHSHVDFANKFLGGGVLGRGAVQEEIIFAICPELVVTCLLCEVMHAKETIVIKGAERYSDYTGYATDFKWVNLHRGADGASERASDSSAPGGDAQGGVDGAAAASGAAASVVVVTRDELRRALTQVVAIDALKIDRWDMQYSERGVLRELNKAFCGFASPHGNASLGIQPLPIATGNWGCGAFGGEKHLKGVLQLMACAVAGRSCVYCTFDDRALAAKLELMHRLLQEYEVCVAEVWGYLMQYCQAYVRSDIDCDVCKFIIEKCNAL